MSTLTPQDRVRASIALTVTSEMAERLLQHDKANPSYRLADLRDDDERAVFLADIMELLSPERRAERAIRLNSLRAHGQAIQEDEQETVLRQARHDRTRFGLVSPGYCHVCRQPVLTDAAVLWLGDALKTDAHGLCCAMDPQERFELIADFSYRLKVTGGAR